MDAAVSRGHLVDRGGADRPAWPRVKCSSMKLVRCSHCHEMIVYRPDDPVIHVGCAIAQDSIDAAVNYIRGDDDPRIDPIRLAEALHEAGLGCMRPLALSRNLCGPTGRLFEINHFEAAALIASKYGALRMAPKS